MAKIITLLTLLHLKCPELYRYWLLLHLKWPKLFHYDFITFKWPKLLRYWLLLHLNGQNYYIIGCYYI